MRYLRLTHLETGKVAVYENKGMYRYGIFIKWERICPNDKYHDNIFNYEIHLAPDCKPNTTNAFDLEWVGEEGLEEARVLNRI